MRTAGLRYLAVAALVAAAAGLLVSCGVAHARTSLAEAASSGRAWWSRVGGACGPPALVHLDGHVLAVGDCAALLVIPATKVTMHVGQQIDVHMTEEGAGHAGKRMVPLYPLPRSSRPSVVMPGAIGPDRATRTYRAVRLGQAVLYSRGLCLASHRKIREFTGSCPVIEVTVVP